MKDVLITICDISCKRVTLPCNEVDILNLKDCTELTVEEKWFCLKHTIEVCVGEAHLDDITITFYEGLGKNYKTDYDLYMYVMNGKIYVSDVNKDGKPVSELTESRDFNDTVSMMIQRLFFYELPQQEPIGTIKSIDNLLADNKIKYIPILTMLCRLLDCVHDINNSITKEMVIVIVLTIMNNHWVIFKGNKKTCEVITNKCKNFQGVGRGYYITDLCKLLQNKIK